MAGLRRWAFSHIAAGEAEEVQCTVEEFHQGLIYSRRICVEMYVCVCFQGALLGLNSWIVCLGVVRQHLDRFL